MKNSNKNKFQALVGGYATAEAMRQINPEVVAAYPITPQTPIIEKFAEFVADKKVDTEFVCVESEHSALSATVGASASGIRAMTATSSQGLALMNEILSVASGLRLPIVMPMVNRALSAPINIHCDHSDSMSTRDLGWIQIFCETAQEAYEYTFLALKLAEKVLLPVMVMQDGFFTSHNVEPVEIYPDEVIKKFIGQYKPKNYLFDLKKPITVGPLVLPDYYFEVKYQEIEAMGGAKKAYLEVGKELKKITGNDYPYFEKYKLDDAEAAIVVSSSSAGTAKVVIDKLRKEGKKVGLLKPILFRPFPQNEIKENLKHLKTLAVLDRSVSFGGEAPLFSEIKNALYPLDKKPKLQSYVFGLGGRDLFEKEVEGVFEELLKNKIGEVKYIGLRK